MTKPLPSKASAGHVVTGILAGVEHLVTNRPRPVAEISEHHRDRWNAAGGLTVEGLDEPVERAEPPDRSGARL
jgi:antitoxin (DNA-binding transcriptional repressor) of toxin-antitoxin stability system